MNEAGILVSLGENWGKGQHNAPRRLSKNSLNTANATDKLLWSGKYHTVIVSTGHTNGPKQLSEAEAMIAHLQTIDPLLFPFFSILSENNSYDTVSNLREVKQLIAEKHLEGPITIVASWSHVRRTKRAAKALGMSLTTIAAEKVLGIRKRVRPEDIALTALSLIDPLGKIPGLVTKRRLR